MNPDDPPQSHLDLPPPDDPPTEQVVNLTWVLWLGLLITPSRSEPSLAFELPGRRVLRFSGTHATEQLADLILAL